MKTFLTTIILIPVISFAVNAQTNVGGGIYANTTWTLANSPYIVIDTIVVFPGVTLTIEPGVVVKFDDHKYIEMRNATLIANANVVDSITFTSNSLTPTPGIWGGSNKGGIWFNFSVATSSFNFCHIEYATTGIYYGNNLGFIKNSTFVNNINGLSSIYSTPIDSCIFKNNTNGINYCNDCSLNFCNISNNTNGIGQMGGGTMINSIIDSNQTGIGGVADVSNTTFLNCTINYNQTGMSGSGDNTLKNCMVNYNSIRGLNLQGPGHRTDSVINCEIKFNGIGLTIATCGGGVVPPSLITQCVIESNATGIQFGACCDIYCNSFCNNTTYDLQNMLSSPVNVSNNYWCTTDSTAIALLIYDGYDNTNLGLVTFLPLDSTCAPGIASAVNEITQLDKIYIYPNPASDYITIESPVDITNSEIKIFNMLGEIAYSSKVTKQKINIDISTLNKGVYIVQISDGAVISRQKLIKQ